MKVVIIYPVSLLEKKLEIKKILIAAQPIGMGCQDKVKISE